MPAPQKYPMLTVKEAAEALGVDPRTIREKLSNGQLKGEKRLLGLKEKWYVNRGDVDSLIQEQRLRGVENHKGRVDTEDLNEFFDDDEDAIDVSPVEPGRASQANGTEQIEAVVRAMTRQFSEELEKSKVVLVQLKAELEDKERQIRLLPDLEKRAEEERKTREAKEFELSALRKELDAVNTKRAEAENELRTQLDAIEELKSETAEARLKREELEEASRKAQEEREMREKEVTEQLTAVQAQLEKLQQPWWKKWFLPRDIESSQ